MTLKEIKLTNIETKEPYCNFITPLDQSPDQLTSILMIDLNWEEIEEIALWFKNGSSSTGFNIYLYQDSMWEIAWLESTRELADVVIINTEESAITDIKMRWIQDVKSWYYGPIKFKGSDRKIERPLDWFVNHAR